MQHANESLSLLDKSDISEIRVYTSPPLMVQRVLAAVCLLLHQPEDWASAKALIGDPNFMRCLMQFQKDHVTPDIAQRLRVYLDDEKFTPDEVGKVSLACRSLCEWVLAVDRYVKVFGNVMPKKARASALRTGRGSLPNSACKTSSLQLRR